MIVPILLACGVLAAGCSSDDDDGAASTTGGDASTTSADETTTSAPPTSDSDTTDSDTTDSDTTSTTSDEATTSTGLPGDEIDFGPRSGDMLAVVGVAHDDVLNVRAIPGVDGDIVDTLAPTFDGVTALGNTRTLDSAGFWIEVDTGSTTGWVSLRFIGYLGVVSDETSTVVAEIGSIPAAETMVDLGQIVAESLASEEPESDIVQVTPPTVGDLGEITFDVIGLGDDAQVGWRLHVFGAEDDGGEFFGLKSVEATALCGRGVTEELFCV